MRYLCVENGILHDTVCCIKQLFEPADHFEHTQPQLSGREIAVLSFHSKDFQETSLWCPEQSALEVLCGYTSTGCFVMHSHSAVRLVRLHLPIGCLNLHIWTIGRSHRNISLIARSFPLSSWYVGQHLRTTGLQTSRALESRSTRRCNSQATAFFVH
jgi:hypothetical protein